MPEQDTNQQTERPAQNDSGWNKTTSFGEPMWVDILKSIWSGLVMLFFTLIIGGALAVAIIAPWGRASHDCSIYCVLRNYFNNWWEAKPASVARPLRFSLTDNRESIKPPRSLTEASIL